VDFHILLTIFSGMLSRLYYSRVNQATGTTLWSVSGLNEVVHNHGQSYHHQSQNYQRPPMQIPIDGIYYNFIK